MAALVWDKTGERKYETGVSNGVLYVMKDTIEENATSNYQTGVVWNGLTSVTMSPEGAEPTDLWADNIKYGTLRSAETLGGTIEAYTYPEEFRACDGSASPAAGIYIGQQARKAFGFSYRTEIGNDTGSETDDGYLIHVIYNCTASPSERAYETVNDSPDAIQFSWEFNTTPVTITGYKPANEITFDSTKLSSAKMTALKASLYGGDNASATLLNPDNLLALLAAVNG